MMVRNGWRGECMGSWSFPDLWYSSDGLSVRQGRGGQQVTFISTSIWLCVGAWWRLSAKGCWPPVPVVPVPRALSLFSSLSPASPLRPVCKEGPGMSRSYGPIYRGKNPMSLNDLRGHCIGPILTPVRICEEVILKQRSLKTFALIL